MPAAYINQGRKEGGREENRRSLVPSKVTSASLMEVISEAQFNKTEKYKSAYFTSHSFIQFVQLLLCTKHVADYEHDAPS